MENNKTSFFLISKLYTYCLIIIGSIYDKVIIMLGQIIIFIISSIWYISIWNIFVDYL